MDSLYEFSLEKLKSDSSGDVQKGKENVTNVIVNSIRNEFKLYYQNGNANIEKMISQLQNTVNEILSRNSGVLMEEVYLAFESSIHELEAEDISGKDFELQELIKDETKNVIESELQKILDYQKQPYMQDFYQDPSPQYLNYTPIANEPISDVNDKKMKLGKVSILGRLYQLTKKLKERIIPSKRKNEETRTAFSRVAHIWYDKDGKERVQPSDEELQEYEKNGLHYTVLRETSTGSELMEHHLGKKISIEQYAKMLPLGVDLGRNEHDETVQHNEQRAKQLNILSKQPTEDSRGMALFRPFLKRLKEINPLKEKNMRKMAKEFEIMAQFMYLIDRDILKGKDIEKLDKLKLEFEANLRGVLVHEQRGTIDYVVFVKLLETVCNTYRKAENDEVAIKVSEDMEKLLAFIKDEKEKRMTRLAIEKPVQQLEGSFAAYITENMTTYIGPEPITMTRDEFLRMLEEKNELAKREGIHLIEKKIYNDTTQKPRKYTAFTFPLERAIKINGRYYVNDDGIFISEDGKEYVMKDDGRLVLKDDDQR